MLTLACAVPVFAGETPPASTAAAQPGALQPRFEMRIPSIRRLVSGVGRSHAGIFVAPLKRILLETARESSAGADPDDAIRLGATLASMPDSSIHAAVFAPDLKGRARWLVRVSWPAQEAGDRLRSLISADAAETLLEGVTVEASGDAYAIRLRGEPIAVLRADGASHAVLSSHTDLAWGETEFSKSELVGDENTIACRLSLNTEKDSGATWLSSFSIVHAVDYSARVGEDGNWEESVQVHWPPIAGMGAKAMLGRVKQTFFVPEESYLAVALDTPVLHGMVDVMAGFHTAEAVQPPDGGAESGDSGGTGTPGSDEPMPVAEDVPAAPIAQSTEKEACIAVLPGVGFLPIPDFVLQFRTRTPKALIKNIEAAAQQQNADARDREQAEPWHEAVVRDHRVFWSDPPVPGSVMPFLLRPVLFVQVETDAKERDRSFLVLGFTSTGPRGFVRRWMDQPRDAPNRFLPQRKKTNGQARLHWAALYRWLQPYANLSLSGAGLTAMLPSADSVRDHLVDSSLTVKTRYSGLSLDHRGPLPLGCLVVPGMLGIAASPDESGGSDLARERLAGRRLKLLYHHARLFRKDVGRWPAEVAELDGYIDFAGHPELLDLPTSASKAWSDWFAAIGETDEPEDEDDDLFDLDTRLYVIHWTPDHWTLGFAPDTFDHLDGLHIDGDGELHRIPKPVAKPSDGGGPTTKPAADAPDSDAENARNDAPQSGQE